MKTVALGLLALVVVAAASFGLADEKEKSGTSAVAVLEDTILDPAALVWGDPPPRLPRGCKATVLFGDPTKKGWFTVRLHAPAGYKIPPHTHPTAEHVTVISGSVHLGHGEKVAESTGRLVKTGGYAVLAAKSVHSAWFTEDSIIQIQSEGPFEMTYVDPADDPRNPRK